MGVCNTTYRECDADHEPMVEPVIEMKVLPVEDAVI
jgi:hypothetical protein